MFESICVPNSKVRHEQLKSLYEQRLNDYDAFTCNQDDSSASIHLVNVERVDKCIAKLKKGKAAGLDELTAEHL
jgi:hypothetical protein